MRRVLPTILLVFIVSACSDAGDADGQAQAPAAASNAAPAVTFEPEQGATSAAKPSGPVSIAYRIIGEPVVGQPLAIDLQITSTLGPRPVSLTYRINDSSALQLAESQAAEMMLTPEAGEQSNTRQVRVIPLREGRLFLNVSASMETADGSMSTVTAIPINVGRASREFERHGNLETDEDGESVRVLSGEESED